MNTTTANAATSTGCPSWCVDHDRNGDDDRLQGSRPPTPASASVPCNSFVRPCHGPFHPR